MTRKVRSHDDLPFPPFPRSSHVACHGRLNLICPFGHRFPEKVKDTVNSGLFLCEGFVEESCEEMRRPMSSSADDHSTIVGFWERSLE